MRGDLRYRLYEAAVQTPELDVEILERLFVARTGRVPLALREDFCGTAALSAAWVGSDDDREAVAVDRDRAVLAYAERVHRAALEDEAERMTLVRADVRAPSDRTFDLVVAMNFSWALFDDAELAEYLANAARCLEDDGLLVLELFGGRDMRRPLVREHRHEDFVYVWEQRAYDAERAILDARISFRRRGVELKDAFTYRFHLRPLDRLCAMLRDAGLTEVELLVEDRRGRYRRARREPRAPLWRGFLVGRSTA
ncbi:MAG TPA: class I SAM-dependent methyltransferase [Sandaracinaceae bacterium]